VADDGEKGNTVWQADVHWERGFRSRAAVREFAIESDEATLAEIHGDLVATSPVGHSLTNPVELDIRLA
jgi:hypothetical protein